MILYEQYKVYGVYTGKDNRQRVVLVNGVVKKGMSYPKYLIEISIGRYLAKDEQVHHKDGNSLNNDLSNLEIVKLGEHQRLHNPEFVKPQLANCYWCGSEFLMTKQHVRSRRVKRSINKAGPFCSKQCTGKYIRSVQLGTTEMNVLKFGEPFTNGNAEPSL